MSDKGIYTALSGASAQNDRLETIANNIANANTPAFKRDQQVFKEYLTSLEKDPTVLEVPRVPSSVESFYDMRGGDKTSVTSVGTFSEFSQGALKPTGNPLDVALEGKGFMEVLSPSGLRWTRAGNFKIDGNGRLVTKEGFPVLAAGTGDPEGRVIDIGKVQGLSIGELGEVYSGGNRVAQLSIVDIVPPDSLHKVGQSLYRLRDNMNPEVSPSTTTKVSQGFLEGSNVDIVREMTDMISAHRIFEASQKAVKAYDALSEKLVNTVPRLE